MTRGLDMGNAILAIRENASLVLAGLVGEMLLLWACFLPPAWNVPAVRAFFGGPIIGLPLPWPLFLLLVPYAAAYLTVRARKRRGDRAVVVAFAVSYAATLLAQAHPLVTRDLYYYAFAGLAPMVHGANPYAVVPNMFPSDPFTRLMGGPIDGWRHAYGPLWTAIAVAVSWFGRAGIVAELLSLKLLSTAFFFGCIPLVERLRLDRGDPSSSRSAVPMLLFAWNPAMLFETVQNGHNDAMMLFFLLLALVLAERGRAASAGAAFAASVLTKYASAIAAPFVLAAVVLRPDGPRGKRERAAAALRFAFAGAAVCVASFAPFWRGFGTLSGAAAQARRFSTLYAGPVALAVGAALSYVGRWPAGPRFLATVAVSGEAAMIVGVAAIAAAGLRRGFDRRTVLLSCAAALALFMLCSGFVMPWYFLWLMPFAAAAGLAPEMVAFTLASFYLYGFLAAPVVAVAAAAVVALRLLRTEKRLAP